MFDMLGQFLAFLILITLAFVISLGFFIANQLEKRKYSSFNKSPVSVPCSNNIFLGDKFLDAKWDSFSVKPFSLNEDELQTIQGFEVGLHSSKPRSNSIGVIKYERVKCFSEKMKKQDSGEIQNHTYANDQVEVIDEESQEWNLISSRIKSTGEIELHAPVIDLDFPVAVVKSKTTGHFHLYIEKPLITSDYFKLINTLYEVGLIGDGNIMQLFNHNTTFLRRGPYEVLLSEQDEDFMDDVRQTLLEW